RSNRSMTEGWRAGQDRPERLESGENEPACVVGDWDRARCSMLRAGHLAHANGARVTLAHRILPTRDMQMTTWNGRLRPDRSRRLGASWPTRFGRNARRAWRIT